MRVDWRVDVKTLNGDLLVRRPFDEKDDAEEFYKAMNQDEDHVIETVPYDTLLISLDARVESDWEVVKRSLVSK